jgi:hypothetical protein
LLVTFQLTAVILSAAPQEVLSIAGIRSAEPKDPKEILRRCRLREFSRKSAALAAGLMKTQIMCSPQIMFLKCSRNPAAAVKERPFMAA